jgi:hypothetical protein
MHPVTRRLKRLAQPRRVALAATVAVALSFALGLSWLEVTKLARRKVNEAVAKAEKKLGMPIEVGKWRLGFGSAYFEDIVVGADAALLVSKVTAEIELNPFADDFGQLESIVVHKVRVKQGLSALKGNVAAAAADDNQSDLEKKGASAQKAVEKLFAALPTKHLLVRSGNIVVADDKGQAAITVRGLKLLVDKTQSKALFQAAWVRTASGLTEQGLEGRFELMPKDAAYRFFLRKRKKGWSVAGRLKKDLSGLETDFDLQSVPAVLEAATADLLGKSPLVNLKGRLRATRDPEGAYAFDATVTSGGSRVNVPLVSSKPLGPVRFDLTAKGSVDLDEKSISVDEAFVDLPAADSKASTRIKLKGEASLPLAFSGQIALEPTDCQTVLDAAPPGILPALKDFKLAGELGATLDFKFDSQNPDAVQYDLSNARYGCKVKSMPPLYSPEHLAGPFTIQRQVGKDEEPIEVSISPMKPGYTPLAQISKNVGIAFTTSEDAAFYVHKGIDTFAIDSALRRNLTEGKVAVGGSTITMQTAKNLFLSPERTLSRKLQELFLAWHLETVLDKDRILEIYMNIVELGPGIYGVTQASEHYFGKHPFDLSLMESAYLAALLPNPKARYQYFCEGKMTPAFSDLVYGIMKRMVTLNRITYDRYYAAMSAGLNFNDQNRAGARDCTRRTWVQKPGSALPRAEE